MMYKKTRISLNVFLCILIVAGYCASIFVAKHFSVELAWENHLIENIQAVLLFLSGIVSIVFSWLYKNRQFRWFAWMVAPLWFILCFRELSWGAVFLEPLGSSQITGPWFSSSVQLWYKPAVYPVLALVVCFSMVVFFTTKQVKTLGLLFNLKNFPVFELLLAIFGSALITVAEGHAGLTQPFGLSEVQALVLEEWAESFVYCSLFVAQWHVLTVLKRYESRGHH